MSAQAQQRVFLVTGANKGIGFEVVKKLAINHPKDLILLGSRDEKRGDEALVQLGSPANVKVFLVDVSSKESIQQAKEEIEKKYGGHLDVLINNAAIASNELTAKALHDTLNTNLYGAKNINDALSPLLRDNGRIVNVSSSLGSTTFKHCSADLQAKLLDPNLTEAQLVDAFTALSKAVDDGKDTASTGFNSFSLPGMDGVNVLYYSASKLGDIVLTRLEARDWSKNYPAKNVTISAVCPGFCATDLNNRAPGGRSPELGADSILHAVYTDNLENGQFWRDGTRLSLE